MTEHSQVSEQAPAQEGADVASDVELVESDSLVEEVSIDGMCGVY